MNRQWAVIAIFAVLVVAFWGMTAIALNLASEREQCSERLIVASINFGAVSEDLCYTKGMDFLGLAPKASLYGNAYVEKIICNTSADPGDRFEFSMTKVLGE